MAIYIRVQNFAFSQGFAAEKGGGNPKERIRLCCIIHHGVKTRNTREPLSKEPVSASGMTGAEFVPGSASELETDSPVSWSKIQLGRGGVNGGFNARQGTYHGRRVEEISYHKSRVYHKGRQTFMEGKRGYA